MVCRAPAIKKTSLGIAPMFVRKITSKNWGTRGSRDHGRYSKNRDVCQQFFMRKGCHMEVQRPLKAIRSKCLDCSGWQPKEVRLCQIVACSLWPYRMGKRPVANPSGGHELSISELNDCMENN
jgi:hypothetical protein